MQMNNSSLSSLFKQNTFSNGVKKGHLKSRDGGDLGHEVIWGRKILLKRIGGV